MSKSELVEFYTIYSRMLLIAIVLLFLCGLGLVFNPKAFALPITLDILLISFLFILKERTAKKITKC